MEAAIRLDDCVASAVRHCRDHLRGVGRMSTSGKVGTSNLVCTKVSVQAHCACAAISASVVTHMPSMALTPFDQLFQRNGLGGTTGNERVVGEDEAAAFEVVGLGFQAPHLEHLGRALDDPAAGDAGVEGVLLPVVERPVDRDFDQGLGGAGCDGETVGLVSVEQTGVVEESALASSPGVCQLVSHQGAR